MSERKRPSGSARHRATRHRPKPGARARKGAPPSTPGGSGSVETTWLYGAHAVLAALANPVRVCYRLLMTPQAAESHGDAVDAAGRAANAPRPVAEPTDRAEIQRILPEGAAHQGLAVLVAALDEVVLEDVVAAAEQSRDVCVVVLDQATDPQNVGAVIRSAAAFGALAVIAQDRHGPPITGALAKAASGAVERVPLVRVKNLARSLWTLKDAGFWCVGLDSQADTDLADATPQARTALVLGAEGKGLRRLIRDTCDVLARIPIAAEADSLNLSNAAAIALYEIARERQSGD